MANKQENVEQKDNVLTPDYIALDIVKHFQPTGRCLDPCRGTGVFFNCLPAGSEWCEIEEGKDFFAYDGAVEWIISNPPYSCFAEWLYHSFTIAANIVYLIPVNKPFNGFKTMRKTREYGGIAEIYAIGPGSWLKFPIGFAVGAVHFKRGYKGGIKMSFMETAVRSK